MMRASMLFMIVAGVVGCSSPDARSVPYGFEARDSAGVVLAKNSGAAPRPLDVTERLVIGTLEGATPGDRVHQVLSIDVTDSDEVVVASEFALISVYSPDGRLIHRLGGHGQGPGEFEFLIAAYQDTTRIIGIDGQVSKVVVFDSAGEFRSSFSAAPPGATGIWPMGVFGPHLLLRPSVSSVRPEPGEIRGRFLPVHRLDLESGELTDSVGWIPVGSVVGGMRNEEFNALDTIGFGRLSSDSTYLIASGAGYVVEERSLDGGLVRRISRDHQPVPVDRPRYRAVLEEYAENAPGPVDVDQRMVGLPDLPFVPPVYMVFPTDDGSVWVWRRDDFDDPMLELAGGTGGDHSAEPPLFDLFDPRGRYVGSWRPPRTEGPLGWGGDWIATVRRDEFGVEYIVVYDVRPGEGV